MVLLLHLIVIYLCHIMISLYHYNILQAQHSRLVALDLNVPMTSTNNDSSAEHDGTSGNHRSYKTRHPHERRERPCGIGRHLLEE